MTLVVDKIPQFICSDTAIELRLIKYNALAVASGRAYMLLVPSVVSPPADGDTLILGIQGIGDVAFIFKSTASFDASDPKHLPEQPFAMPWAQYAQLLSEHIYRHPLIKKYYTVNVAGISGTGSIVIQILARQRGKDYNISVGVSSTVTLSPNTVELGYADDDMALANYKVQLSVDLISDILYNPTLRRIDSIELYGMLEPDNDRIVLTAHDLPELSKMAMPIEIPYNLHAIRPARYVSAKLYMEANEQYGNNYGKGLIQTYNDMANVNDTTAINAGITLDKYNWEISLFSWIRLMVSGQQKFFTFQPRLKVVSKAQPELMLYVFNVTGTTYIEFIVTYNDGSTASTSKSFTQPLGGFYWLPTGFDQNNLASINPDPSNLIEISYTVKVTDPVGTDSEILNYIIDTRHHNDERYFMLQNSLGGYDTLRCTGVNEYSIKRTGETNGKAIASDSRAAQGSIEMTVNELEQTWTMRTGWLMNREEKAYLEELLRSQYVAEVQVPLYAPGTDIWGSAEIYKQHLRSVIVQQSEVVMWEEKDGMWAMEWKMSYADKVKNYSPLPLVKEVFYDTQIEFSIYSRDAGDIYITFGSGASKVTVNGSVVSGGIITCNANQWYKVKAEGYLCTTLQVYNASVDADIYFNHISTIDLLTLSIDHFTNIDVAGLCERLKTLYSLSALQLLGGFDVDRVLGALRVLYDTGKASIATVDLSYSTPSAAGYIIRDNLINDGVIITTV